MDRLLVINKALMKAGLPLAASLNDVDWNAQLVFESCVDEALRGFAWGFAQRFEVLGMSGAPAHGYRYGYGLPGDCLRVIDVHCMHDLRSPRARYVVSGRNLYCNVSPCNLRYVARNYEPEEWPVDFADAVACRIAMEIASLSTQTMKLLPSMMQLYQAALAQAQATDGRETQERVPLDESIWLARAADVGGRR